MIIILRESRKLNANNIFRVFFEFEEFEVYD